MRCTLSTIGVRFIASLLSFPASADNWCEFAKRRYAINHEICPTWAKEDDAACSKQGKQGQPSYEGCRLGLMLRHMNTTTPPGPLRIVDCHLPDGSVIATADMTCVIHMRGRIVPP